MRQDRKAPVVQQPEAHLGRVAVTSAACSKPSHRQEGRTARQQDPTQLQRLTQQQQLLRLSPYLMLHCLYYLLLEKQAMQRRSCGC
jgi:hypothetical protein